MTKYLGHRLIHFNNQSNDNIPSKCNKQRCIVCPVLNQNNKVQSNVTGDFYKTIVKNDTCCTTDGVIYLLSCKICGCQYVGETARALNKRIIEHRAAIKKNDVHSYCYQHFNGTGHSKDSFSVSILEVVGTDKSKLLDRENFWIRILNTAYPFGLNDKIQGYGIISTDAIDPTDKKGHPYFNFRFPRLKRSHGRKRRKVKTRNIKDEWTMLEQNVNLCGENIRKIYQLLSSFSKYAWKQIVTTIMQNNQQYSNLTQQLSLAFVAHCFWRKTTGKEEKIRITIPFVDKSVEYANINHILNRKDLMRILKIDGKNIPKPEILYKYDTPISLKLVNYKKELRNLTLEKLTSIKSGTCNCISSDFLYIPLGHVITGNLDIVQNKELREIFLKGTKYREPKKMDFKRLSHTIKEAGYQYIGKINNIIQEEQREEWIRKFNQVIITEIKQVEHKYSRKGTANLENIMEKSEIKYALKTLQDQYIIVSVDKAPNNYSFICKKYYMDVMCKELGVVFQNGTYNICGNGTYILSDEKEEEIVKKHDKLLQTMDRTTEEEDKCVPILYAIPKMHKTPYKMRMIAGASKSSMKEVSVIVMRALLHMRNHLRNYCNLIKTRTGIKPYVAVDGSYQTISQLQKIKVKEDTKIYCADFASLFTNLPHDLLLTNMQKLIKLCYNNSGKKFLALGYEKCYYTSETNKRKGTIYLERQDIAYLVHQVLKNGYVTFAGKCFQQICGVPMGGNASPMLADLTLSMLEFEYLNNKDNAQLARIFQNTYRYMDDLLTIFRDKNLNIFDSMYPPSLTLEQTNSVDHVANYLDLTITIHQGKILTKVYNKTDDYNFKVVRYPKSDSNMHTAIAYNCFQSEILRFSRLTTKIEHFEERLIGLSNYYKNNGFDRAIQYGLLLQIFKKRKGVAYKFGLVDSHLIVTFSKKVMNLI